MARSAARNGFGLRRGSRDGHREQTGGGVPVPMRSSRPSKGRLQALASAHSLLTRRSWESADLADLARHQLGLHGDEERISVTGPRALLQPEPGVVTAVARHELGANARSYGSLTTLAGRLVYASAS